MQKLHREHTVYYFKFSTRSFNQLSFQWIRHQIFRISLQTSSNTNISIHIENLIETTRYIDQKFKTLKNFLVSINQFALRFLDFRYFQMIYHITYSQISWFMSRNQISNWNSKTFSFFYSVFVLITNEHRMHAQKSAKKNVFSSYEMRRCFRLFHALIIFSLRFKKWIF